MAKYRVYAENEEGTSGESPPFWADSPEEAEAQYLSSRPTPLTVVKVELEED